MKEKCTRIAPVKPRARSHNGGFTLIELSIALVIIALVVGGIVVGRELIATAKLRQQINQIEGYTAAVTAFKLKFNCLPGDCPSAVSFGLGTAPGPGQNGNGDQKIYSPVPSGGYLGPNWSIQRERLNFWYHLYVSDFIAFTARGYDTSTAPADMTGYNPVPITGAPVAGVGAVSVDSASGSNDFFITSVSTVSYSYLWNVMEAYYIDSKLDDGRPNSGKVRTTASYGRPSLHGSSAGCNGHPSTNDTGEYDLKGSWDTGGWEAVTDRPNVTRIECGLAFLNRF